MNIKSKYIFFFLCLTFIIYSFSIYLTPGYLKNPEAETVAAGRLVWQKYNCQSCHQLYGLGGYLGPDLTNVYSAKGKGELFIKAFLHTGTKQMPSFALSKEEEKDLIAFLKSTDHSGIADPRNFVIKSTGMIEKK